MALACLCSPDFGQVKTIIVVENAYEYIINPIDLLGSLVNGEG